MRSIKLSLTVAGSIATVCVATSAFADPPSAPADKTTSTTSTTTTAPIAPAAPVGQPVMTAPPPQVIPNADGTMPTSTTSTTSADTEPSNTQAVSQDVVVKHKGPNKAWLITGGALLIGTYATTAGIEGAKNRPGDHDLYIPVAGPWIDLAQRNWSQTKNIDTVLIMGSGILQGVGTGMALASFFIPEKSKVATVGMINVGPVKMNISPTAGAGMGGAGAVGTF